MWQDVGERRYHQFCGVAKALDLVGERWTLLLVRDLLLGGRRFSDLQEAMPGLTPNLLSQRLRQMTERGLIEKQQLDPPRGTTVYVLTELGHELEPVVLALGRFGSNFMTAPGPDDRVDPRWAMVSLKRRYQGCPRRWRVQLEVGPLAFSLKLGDERLHVVDGRAHEADLVVGGQRPGWGMLLSGRGSAQELLASGQLHHRGPARAMTDFVRAFALKP
ncbi:MAG: winged helix-turn-helix transcriptional regulator [Deltaproteobacteria bacterium]|nr:winged helix-turn-helix transcriptional regulator [Deltaproteobacteria bacterium]